MGHRKAFCQVCGQFFTLSPAFLTEDKSKPDFYLLPEHKPKIRCETTDVVSEKDGHVIKTFCNGSFRPAKEEIMTH